jgi:hypothetical protein
VSASPVDALKRAERTALKGRGDTSPREHGYAKPSTAVAEHPAERGEKPKAKVVERPFGMPDAVSGAPFYEQAMVGGKLCFIVVPERGRIDFRDEIVVKGGSGVETVIRPRLDLPYNNYSVKPEWLENPGSTLQDDVWPLGKRLLEIYVDFLEPWHAPISMSSVILSYFKDAFRSVPYIYALGDTDSGKSRWAQTVAKLAYRAHYGESPPTADVYEFLTHCGSTIVEDEAQGLERDREKLKLYKVGYQHGAKTMRILINRNTGERRQVFYNAYGVKFFAGEEQVKDKGFMDRCLVIPFVKGHPQKDEFDPADDPVFEEVRGKLLAMRILERAGRISVNPYTCGEPWFEGRFKELYKPLLTVMPEAERRLICEAARERYEAKRAETTESTEAKCVVAYLKAVKANNGDPYVSTEIIHEYLKPMIANIPEQYRPGLRGIGMKLTKLGFKSSRITVSGKTVRVRYPDASTITKLVRKYDLAEVLKEEGLELPIPGLPCQPGRTPPIHLEVGQVVKVGQPSFSPSPTMGVTGETIENNGKKPVGQPGQPRQPLGNIEYKNSKGIAMPHVPEVPAFEGRTGIQPADGIAPKVPLTSEAGDLGGSHDVEGHSTPEDVEKHPSVEPVFSHPLSEPLPSPVQPEEPVSVEGSPISKTPGADSEKKPETVRSVGGVETPPGGSAVGSEDWWVTGTKDVCRTCWKYRHYEMFENHGYVRRLGEAGEGRCEDCGARGDVIRLELRSRGSTG